MNTPLKNVPVEDRIFFIRGEKVMLSNDLAELYGIEPRVLVQAVKRNIERFPEDFMFQLNEKEFLNLKSQIVISSWGGARRAKPYAFTEQGVAMLSGVLNSKSAIRVNIQIMRAFVKLRSLISGNKELALQMKLLENKVDKHDESIKAIFQVIRQLMIEPEKQRKRIGFRQD